MQLRLRKAAVALLSLKGWMPATDAACPLLVLKQNIGIHLPALSWISDPELFRRANFSSKGETRFEVR